MYAKDLPPAVGRTKTAVKFDDSMNTFYAFAEAATSEHDIYIVDYHLIKHALLGLPSDE